MNFNFLSLLIFFFLFGDLSAQQNIISPFEKAKNNILLLKNKGVVPIRKIDDAKIAIINIGDEKESAFLTCLEKYTKIDAFNIPTDGDLTSMLPLFQDIISNHNLLIIKYDTETEIGPTMKSFINYFSKESKIILSVFGKPENAVDVFNEFDPDALFLAVKNGALEQEIMAQAIFGAIDLKPQELKNYFADFPLVLSLFVPNLNRLGFATPDVVKMDSILLYEKIQQIVEEGINKEAFPGAQVLVAKDGKIIYHEVFGFHTYQNEVSVKHSDIYDLASVTKISAGLPIIMQLHSIGEFDLNATWGDYYPEFRHTNKADLKWKDILSHQARLEPWLPNWKLTQRRSGKFKWFTVRKKPSEKYSIQLREDLYLNKKYRPKILKAIKKSPLLKEYGYKYSGLAFYVLPDMLTNMIKTDFETYLNEKIYKPLGATTLGFKPLEKFPKSRIVPTERDSVFRHTLMQGIVHDEGANMMGQVSGNAGLFSNANDLAKLMQMYLNQGTYGGIEYIAPETIALFTKCHFCEDGNRRGLGFDKPMIDYVRSESHTAKEASSASYGHSGYTGTFVWMDPKYDLLFIFMSNRVYPSRTHRNIYKLDIRPRIQEAIYDSIYEWKKKEAKRKLRME